MKLNLVSLLLCVGLRLAAGAGTLHAQALVTPVPAEPVPVVVPAPGQHVAEIEVVVSKGFVQAYFGQAAKGEKLELGNAEINIKLPSTATVDKLAARDNSSAGSKRITPDNPWKVQVPFDGPGRFVFNVVGWYENPTVVSAVLRIDGAVVFSGRGSEDNFDGWAEVHYAKGVAKTGSREIAFVVGR